MTIKNLFPVQRPYYQFNFSNTGGVDPLAIFTRSTTGNYVDANGVIKTAEINEPRFLYDQTTKEPLGLAIQPAITNLWFGSDACAPQTGSTSDWVEHNNGGSFDFSTVTTGGAVAAVGTTPDGLSTSSMISYNETTDFEQQVLRINDYTGAEMVPALGSYQLSFFVKKIGTADRILAVTTRADSGQVTVSSNFNYRWSDGKQVDLSGLPGNVDAEVTELANGWVRFSVPLNITNVTTTPSDYRFSVSLSSADVATDSTIHAGDPTSGFAMYGMQLEAGTASSEYQSNPNQSSATTIARDSLQVLIPEPSNAPQSLIFRFLSL